MFVFFIYIVFNIFKAYFLVLARDKEDRGIFLRTFYFSGQMSRGKMKKARVILKQSTINYFKRDV